MKNLNIYKRGQAKNTRLWTAILVFVIVAYGCFVLHQKLSTMNNIWVETLVPFGLCAIIGGAIAWLMNKPSVADFLISSEGEIKKVSWSTRKEIVSSTSVVIFVMLSISIFLYLVDMGFVLLFTRIGLY
ncbi:MAG: preprotein translocase subunit SecE [Anaerohalosphaeraceae bacterium]